MLLRNAEALQASALSLGAPMTPDAAQRMICFLDLLTRWNRQHNLTAVRDPAAMWSHHLLDSLSIVETLDHFLNDASSIVLDVGSGAGFPGVIIAVSRPSWRVICVDSVAKKAAFVRQAAIELAVPNLDAVHGRIEDASPLNANVIVSRAFSDLAKLIELTRFHLAKDGIWVAMKGRRPDQEIQAVGEMVEVFHVKPLIIPGLNAERHLVCMRSTESELRSSNRIPP